MTVYVYRTVLDSVNGVSSTRYTSLAALSFQEGEIRQLQFVEDDTLMVLWSDASTCNTLVHRGDDVLILTTHVEGHSYLLNFPFQPASALLTSEKSDPPPLILDYTGCDTHPSRPKPSVQTTSLDLPPSLSQTGILRHVFATSGPKAKPVRIDVNGRKGRRAVCVLYGDAMRYDVLDLDAAMVNEDDEEGEEQGQGQQ